MTPAITALETAGVSFTLHPYAHTGDADGFGDEAASKLGVEPGRMFKTLVVKTDADDLLLALVPVSARLDLKALRNLLGVSKVEMADPKIAERTTGYVVGGISPLGGRRQLPAVIDETVDLYDTVFFSAGRRGLQVELTPADLVRLTDAKTGAIAEEK